MATLEKRDWLLLLLRERPLDRIRIMKALFLVWHRSGRKIPSFYDFVPYMYGPCSFDLYPELDSAEREQLITQAPHPVARWAPYFLTSRGIDRAASAATKMDQTSLKLVQSVAREANSMGFYQLLRQVYAEAPDFASESVIERERQQ